MEDRPVRSRELDVGIITDAEGRIIANGMQQDLVFLRNTYADGTVDIWSRPRSGRSAYRLLIPRYDPEKSHPKCRHCGEEL